MRVSPLAFLVVAAMLLASSLAEDGSARGADRVDGATYWRAAQFSPEFVDRFVLNGSVSVHWRGGAREGFTYKRRNPDDTSEFVAVDAATGARASPFDPVVIADGLRLAAGRAVDPKHLPFQDFEAPAPGSIEMSAFGTTWLCQTTRPNCTPEPALEDRPEVKSPDGRWSALIETYNLAVRAKSGGTPVLLTVDGVARSAYGAPFVNALDQRRYAAYHFTPKPSVVWSPDSRYLLTQRFDLGATAEATLKQSSPGGSSVRPIAYTFPYSLPGDTEEPTSQAFIADRETKVVRRLDFGPDHPRIQKLWWSSDGARAYALTVSRYAKAMQLLQIDPRSGAASVLIGERGLTFVEFASIGQRPNVRVLKTGEVLWFSERDGWGRLYLYDARGRLVRQLTQGPWSVRNIVRLDERRRLVYVEGAEREPQEDAYFRSLYSISLDGAAVRRLTPEDADHAVEAEADAGGQGAAASGFSPSGSYFIDTFTRPDLPPQVLLRRANGDLVAKVEAADVARIRSFGFTPPERFKALAADGETTLYGVVFRPSNFDARKRYPVIDSIYPGPQITRVQPTFLGSIFDRADGQAIAELGFIVVALDGRGTPERSKTFHDASYGPGFQEGRFDDHIAVLRQLSARLPQMDLGRLGVIGSSAGGFASLHACLAYPDLFKACVADAGTHDAALALQGWGETYAGPLTSDQYKASSNEAIAGRLKAKLLLVHGELDNNTLPYQTLQVVDALIKSNKDFELLLVPNAGHAPTLVRGYAKRRVWDFLITNLMLAEPADHFDLSTIAPR